MKSYIKYLFATLCFAAVLSSCGSSSKMKESVDFTNGRQAGTALVSLAKEYVSNGSINFQNVNNILNMATLANTLTSLRSDSNLAHKDFISGLMSSCGTVTKSNQNEVHDALEALSQMDVDTVMNRLQKSKVDAKTEFMKEQLESVLSMLKK